jgi:5-methyltetrahydropteroyltriglutamate--homocysteine methyltransferase
MAVPLAWAIPEAHAKGGKGAWSTGSCSHSRTATPAATAAGAARRSFAGTASARARASVTDAAHRVESRITRQLSSRRTGGSCRLKRRTRLKAFAPGIYARSEALIQATRDLDRGRTAPEAVAQQRRRDVEALISAQEEAGLDLLSDGLLDWQDIFRPLAERSDGLTARPLTRFLDTNTFYRALLVDGKPRLREPVPAPDLPAGRWLATLPAPLAIARAARGEAGASAFATRVLAPQIEAYAAAGCALVVLVDPFLAREGGVEEEIAALRELAVSVPIALQLPFGDASGALEELATAPVEAVGVDFYATALEGVPEGYPKEILAGVVDVRSSALEEPEQIAAFVEGLLRRGVPGVSLGVNGDLQFVPEPVAREKLLRLGRARALLSEGVAA